MATVQREEEWREGPVHPTVVAYGTHRRLLQSLSDCYYRQYGVRTINWLVANAYGPGDSTDPNKVHALNGIIIRLLQAQAAGKRSFEIWGSGTPVREWVYVDDVARILLASLDIDEQIEPVNFAQNRGYSILEIAEIASRLMRYPVEFEFRTDMPDGAPIKVLDNSRFQRAHADFAFTPLEDGVLETIAYYQTALRTAAPILS
jgi:GDP-L-fucose synthase